MNASNIIELNENGKTILSKLLSKENISVVFGNFKTASFAPKERILQLPNWECPKDVSSLFIGHEVGHALFTPKDSLSDFKIKFPDVSLSVLNIIEDVRIERLIINEYPGLFGSFNRGYKHLYDNGFFCYGAPFETLSTADKFNVYAKCRHAIPGLDLPPHIKSVYDLVYAAETMDDLFALVPQFVAMIKRMPADVTRESASNLPGDGDGSIVGGDNRCADIREQNDSLSDDDLMFKSESSLARMTSKEYINDENYIVSSPTKEEALTKIRWYDKNNKPMIPSIPRYQNRNVSNKKVVDLYVKNFMRRKAARSYSKAKISKSGKIDVNRLHSYIYDTHIFKSVTTLFDEKSHGMVMLLDFSASMCDTMKHVIDETINLCDFCRRASIPFKVFSFTSLIFEMTPPEPSLFIGLSKVDCSGLMINEMIHSGLKESEYKDALYHLHYIGELIHAKNTTARQNMGGTPLFQSLLVMNRIIEKLKRDWNVEKMNLVVLSDGYDTGISITNRDENMNKRKVKIKHDRFLVGLNESNTYASFIDLVKKSTGAKVLGFYITNTKGAVDFIKSGTSETKHSAIATINSADHPFNKKGAFTLEGAHNYDVMVILNEEAYKKSSSDIMSRPATHLNEIGLTRLFKLSRENYIRSTSFVRTFIEVLS